MNAGTGLIWDINELQKNIWADLSPIKKFYQEFLNDIAPSYVAKSSIKK